MATHDQLPAAMLNSHPTSPPMTPGHRSQHRFPPQTHQTSPLYKRMGIFKLVSTPPLEFIEPTGQGHQFKFTRPQSCEPSSRPSTASGQGTGTTPRETDDEEESEEESEQDSEEESEPEPQRPMRRTDTAHFILEELDSDPGYDSDIEVLLPDHYEDAKSDNGTKAEVFARLKELQLDEDSSDEDEREERQRRYRQKKKRWSAGVFKRSHSQSVEGDSSYSDNDPLDDVDPNARRLRRRVRGPCDRRGSLIFEDRGFSNTTNIAEVDEPEEGIRIPFSQGPPSIPSDDAFTLDELPFWKGGDLMDLEFESDY